MGDWQREEPSFWEPYWPEEFQAMEEAHASGAAAAFGLMGMAEAIRDRWWHCAGCDSDVRGNPTKCEWCATPRGASDDRSVDR